MSSFMSLHCYVAARANAARKAEVLAGFDPVAAAEEILVSAAVSSAVPVSAVSASSRG